MNMRSHSSYIAFVIHRISGLCLALFVPVHLYVISLLFYNPQKLEQFLSWTSTPLVKLSETILILLAAIHLTGGLRIVIYEWFWAQPKQNSWIAATLVLSIVIGIIFQISSSL